MKPETLLNLICNGTLPQRVIVRVDAGAVRGLSYGHLSRCLVLAKALKKNSDAKISFLMRDYPEGVTYARKNGMEVRTIPLDLSQAEHDAFWIQKTRELKPDWTFIDLPWLESCSPIFPLLKKQGSKTLFIDDARFISPKVDTLLNSSILTGKQTILKHPGTQYLLGPDYLIFDQTATPPKRTDKKFRILISFGGSDPSGLTLNVVRAIAPLITKPEFILSVILGPGFTEKKKETTNLLEQEKWVTLINAPEDIYAHFLNSDLVICAGGRTLYELNQLNVPAFPISSIAHERPVINAFIEDKIVETGMLAWDIDEFRLKIEGILNKHCQ